MSRHFWRACGCEPQSGLTLVELLVTIVIAGIAFAAIVPVFVQALTTSSQEKVRLAALNVAQDRIEKIRQLDFDQIAKDNLALNNNAGTWKYASEFGSEWISDTGRGRVYSVYYWVEESLNTKQVYVTVDWTAPPRRVPNTFVHWHGDDSTVGPGYGVTLSTIIYKQYGGAQVIDINTIPDSSDGEVLWEYDPQIPLNMIIKAVLNPADDNSTTADYAVFKGYGANDVLVLDETVNTRVSGRFQVTWSPLTDGSTDGTYRFEVTVFSTKGLPGNSYAEEFRLETGPPLAAQGLTATPGNQLVTLAWNKSQSADVVSYEVSRRDVTAVGAVGAFSPVAEDWTSTVYTDSPLTNGHHYQYYVVAVDRAGKTSVQSSTVEAYPEVQSDVHAPPSPVLKNLPTPGKARLTWPDVVDPLIVGEQTTGIDHYVVTRDDGQVYSVVSPKSPATVEFIQSIAANHSYTVVALDAVGNQSAPAGPVTVTYTPPPNCNLVVSANLSATFTVRDADNKHPDAKTGTTCTWSLPEGVYYVTAKIANQTRGPVTVDLSADTTLIPFIFF